MRMTLVVRSREKRVKLVNGSVPEYSQIFTGRASSFFKIQNVS